jgi:hypothetical protein
VALGKIFLYGDSWERYPITEGAEWTDPGTGSVVAVSDIRNPLPKFMVGAEMVYSDPPWDLNNINAFLTKAGRADYVDRFPSFLDVFFNRLREIHPKVCYLEMGVKNAALVREHLKQDFASVQEWPILYYRKHPCFLFRGGPTPVEMDFSGLDDSETPFTAIISECPVSVADLCTGRGLTAVAAFKANVRFFGTEINRRRLAVALDRVNRIGGAYAPRPIP